MQWLALLLMVLPAGSALARDQHERKRTERAEIVQLEQKWRQAQLADDISTMDRLLADEFLGITASGQVVTKGQQLDRMRTHNFALTELDISDLKMKISGNLAVVTSLAHMNGTVNGKPLRGNFRYTRVYHRVGRGEWKITNFEATRVGTGEETLKPSPPPETPRTGSSALPAALSSCFPAFPAGCAFPPARS